MIEPHAQDMHTTYIRAYMQLYTYIQLEASLYTHDCVEYEHYHNIMEQMHVWYICMCV